jgi:hypothetical protein
LCANSENSSAPRAKFSGGEEAFAGPAAGPLGEDFCETAEDFSGSEHEFSDPGSQNSSFSGPITTITPPPPDPDLKEVSSKQIRSANAQNSRSKAFEEQKILAYWLVKGEIGRKTPKMRELLAADLDLETVKAHVLERLAWQAGLIGEGSSYSAGLLITKLLGGDPPPPMRCEKCLGLPNKNGLCRCDFEAVIQR